MKLFWLFILTSLFSFGHEDNEAYYTIQQEGSKIQVRATFSWTLRNELLDFDESLVNAQSQEYFVNVLNDYVAQKFRFYSGSDSSELLDITEKPTIGFSSADFEFNFELKGEVESFKNEMMLNVYPKQQNIHTFLNSTYVAADSLLISNRQLPKIYLKPKKTRMRSFWWVGGLIITIGVFIYQFKKEQAKKTSID